MKVLMINVVCGIRSTGRICTDLAAALEKQGHEVKIAYGREKVPEKFQRYAVRIGTDLDVKMHGVRARLFDGCGFGSRKATEKFIKWVKAYDPDVIHLHNIHGYYINIEILFDYLRTCGKKIIWTLHDCWAFTGHAAFCEGAQCEKWVSGCNDCPKRKEYPASFIDHSKDNWRRKKNILDQIPDMTIVTPSKWLSDLTKKSYLAQYPVIVIHNGIDTTVFKPMAGEVKERLGIARERNIILGVAAVWEERKGLSDFYRLNEALDDSFQIVLVGLSKEQIDRLPASIIGLERTDSVEELVELYGSAYVFANPTYEDNYPTTNLEAIACGTPVITYQTGGSPESALYYGAVVNKGNVSAMADLIKKHHFLKNGAWCPEHMDSKETVNKYLRLYA